MPVSDAPRPARTTPVPAAAPRLDDPAGVSFSAASGVVGLSGTTMLEIDLAPLLAAARSSSLAA